MQIVPTVVEICFISCHLILSIWIHMRSGKMTVADARNFLKQAITDSQLRDQLNGAPTRDEITTILKTHDYHFTPAELDEAYHGILVQCQTEEEAALTREIKGWWDFLLAATTR
jgi:hypothetical protein